LNRTIFALVLCIPLIIFIAASVTAQKPSSSFIVRLISGDVDTGVVKITIEDVSSSTPVVIDEKAVNVNTDDLPVSFNVKSVGNNVKSSDIQACAEIGSTKKRICKPLSDPIDLSQAK
jgi:hypothetical protein